MTLRVLTKSKYKFFNLHYVPLVVLFMKQQVLTLASIPGHQETLYVSLVVCERSRTRHTLICRLNVQIYSRTYVFIYCWQKCTVQGLIQGGWIGWLATPPLPPLHFACPIIMHIHYHLQAMYWEGKHAKPHNSSHPLHNNPSSAPAVTHI